MGSFRAGGALFHVVVDPVEGCGDGFFPEADSASAFVFVQRKHQTGEGQSRLFIRPCIRSLS